MGPPSAAGRPAAATAGRRTSSGAANVRSPAARRRRGSRCIAQPPLGPPPVGRPAATARRPLPPAPVTRAAPPSEHHARHHLVEHRDDRVRGHSTRQAGPQSEEVAAERKLGHPHHVVGEYVPRGKGWAQHPERSARDQAQGSQRPTAGKDTFSLTPSSDWPIQPPHTTHGVVEPFKESPRLTRVTESSGTLRGLLRSGAGIAVAMAIQNVATYGFTIFAARRLGPADYGAVASLMGPMLVVVVLALGLQATGARKIAAAPIAARRSRPR